MKECPNRECPDYDIIGSEHSCRAGRLPQYCERARKWHCGAVVVRDEEVDDGTLPKTSRGSILLSLSSEGLRL